MNGDAKSAGPDASRDQAAVPGADVLLRALIKSEVRRVRPDKLPHDWADEARFREDLGLDSLDLVEMIARLEQKTGVYVPDPDLPLLQSVAATEEYLGRQFAAGAVRPRGLTQARV